MFKEMFGFSLTFQCQWNAPTFQRARWRLPCGKQLTSKTLWLRFDLPQCAKEQNSLLEAGIFYQSKDGSQTLFYYFHKINYGSVNLLSLLFPLLIPYNKKSL